MTFLSINGLYIWNAVWFSALTILLLIILVKNQAYTPAIGFFVGFILTSSMFVPLSLEYTWNYPVMLITYILACLFAIKKKEQWYGVLFLCAGMVTNYLDFLTTETLTLTVPLLLLLWFDRENSIIKSINAGVAWLIGYAGVWILKWILASCILHLNAMSYVNSHIAERLDDRDNYPKSLIAYLFKTLFRNIKLMVPFEYGFIGLIVGVLLIVLYLYWVYVYREKNYDKKRVLLFILIGCIPYVRYLVLHSHSYNHFFFTFRAQLAVVLSMAFILKETGAFDTIKRRCKHAKR